ncbi:hypothetical protein FA13DRAFT_1788480 [Coprinellus micaceus]|uniref:Uncharacterized protein n=1 Tax=Coprinellus micaceus TaxID=71717 RepID=A0A4Y7TKZ3_COPMI|nr:hypothetical protein FA13DRAFT_1788480 [Coprinellus micaceus]
MSESLEHPTHPPFVETIPPQIVSTPTSLQDLNQQAQEFEAFILKHCHDPTLERVLSTTLGKLPALRRLRAEVANGRPFAGYMAWLETKIVVKKPALAPHQLAPTQPGPRSTRRRRKVTGKAVTVGHSPLKARKVVVRAPRKNLAQVAVQLAQTRSKPGPYFVPPLDHACDYCVSQGLSHKCLYPSAKAAVCVICRARKRPCVCNERRAVLGLEPKEKEALAPKLRASRIGHLDGAEDSADDLTALPSFSGPQQGGDPSGTETLDFSAGIGAQDAMVRANLDGVSARLATLQGIISSAANVMPCKRSPRSSVRRQRLALHSICIHYSRNSDHSGQPTVNTSLSSN